MVLKGEFKKAEQMFHVALKLAQEQQNYVAVTHIYDLLANLAYEQGEHEKAEKLFVSVMQRLLSTGTPKTDNKLIHISLKLANIYRIQKDTRKAEEGFKFCASNLQNNIEEGKYDDDTLLLWAMTLDWYARFLVDVNRLPEAFENFKRAYDLCVQINGVNNEEIVILLNDLGTICFVQNDLDNAISYLTQAVTIGNKLPDMEDFGSVLINLGTMYAKKGMMEEAKQLYQDAWKNAKEHNNAQVLKEASSCLDELKSSKTAQQ
ncbi:tetratricopeptide repeat protein 19 homolog, mitochondrial isoform X2 [Cryptotermes secundus]|uniref:tetratricopeptide repeat protein 19 homolog, mitochondrial isoform X2 n=1 Tax=Cryptotermes secundus TaxID=105785 RepID=UPI000CD7DA6B|nr:tetratricopeptide repeat protein 19 homolog, mitochondrial isoform X2 [Cryptotermes secundus]